jgi:glutaredoxin
MTTPPRTLVMYSRSFGCPFITVAKRVLKDYAVPYREIHIDRDEDARARVIAWTGFQSVPTLIVADGESTEPFEPPAPLEPGSSPRGIDRGAMITEATVEQLSAWLLRHGLIDAIVTD